MSSLYFRVRERVRRNQTISQLLYLTQALQASLFGRVARQTRAAVDKRGGVAVCMRFRDEAPYIEEWLDYHILAGVDHFFLYNNYSSDHYNELLQPYVASGHATLIDWPRTPASPAAEEDALLRALGRYQWIGFIDADEFLVIRGGRSIGEFLSEYEAFPAVVLHWRYFGSNGHVERPKAPVIEAYTRSAAGPNGHVKSFLQAKWAAQGRNPQSWCYRGVRSAVNENRKAVLGSVSRPPSAELAWLNHYYCKSEQDYLEKAQRKSSLDHVSIRFPSRTIAKLKTELAQYNDVYNPCAIEYREQRRAIAARNRTLISPDTPPVILRQSR